MPRAKYTAQYGATDRGQIAITAGDAEAQTDTVSVNVDYTNASRAEVVHILDKIKAKILAEPFPPAV